MQTKHLERVVALQRLAFPPPFDESLLWNPDHLQAHLDKFPSGQWVAIHGDTVVGSCSNTSLSFDHYQKHLSWDETVGGYFLETFDQNGQVLYGLDISVHPEFRRMGIGRSFYAERKKLVARQFDFYATTCRIPDFADSGVHDVRNYVREVKAGRRLDRTLSPLLRYNLESIDVLTNHMDDPESGHAAVLLEWRP